MSSQIGLVTTIAATNTKFSMSVRQETCHNRLQGIAKPKHLSGLVPTAYAYTQKNRRILGSRRREISSPASGLFAMTECLP